MAVTRLKRKDRRNKAVAKNKVARIQQLNSKPVIKNVDVEAITEEFASKGKKVKTAAKKVEEPKEEVVEAAATEEVKAEEVKEKAKPKKAPKAKKEEAKEAPEAEAKEAE